MLGGSWTHALNYRPTVIRQAHSYQAFPPPAYWSMQNGQFYLWLSFKSLAVSDQKHEVGTAWEWRVSRPILYTWASIKCPSQCASIDLHKSSSIITMSQRQLSLLRPNSTLAAISTAAKQYLRYSFRPWHSLPTSNWHTRAYTGMNSLEHSAPAWQHCAFKLLQNNDVRT